MTKLALLVAIAAVALSATAGAQAADSALPGVNTALTPPDTSLHPPLSPRRAFLTSLLAPGYAQTRLERPHAAMLFAVVEIGAIGMAMKSAQDLREAKGVPKDSIVATYKTDAAGKAVLDPKTGLPVPDTYIKSRFNLDRVKARRVHYEDWIAAIAFNHLFAGADAYVAANLWDFRANIGVTATPSSAKVSASIAF